MIIEGSPSSSGQKNTRGFIERPELRRTGSTSRWSKAHIRRELPNPRSLLFSPNNAASEVPAGASLCILDLPAKTLASENNQDSATIRVSVLNR
jgi:hypothetical protein